MFWTFREEPFSKEVKKKLKKPGCFSTPNESRSVNGLKRSDYVFSDPTVGSNTMRRSVFGHLMRRSVFGHQSRGCVFFRSVLIRHRFINTTQNDDLIWSDSVLRHCIVVGSTLQRYRNVGGSIRRCGKHFIIFSAKRLRFDSQLWQLKI